MFDSHLRLVQPAEEQTFVCSTCQQSKPESERRSRGHQCKACRSRAHAKYREKNHEKYIAWRREWLHRTRARQLWLSARARAKRKGVPFEISVDDIFVPEFCPVLGIKLEQGRGKGRRDHSPTLDRIEPSLGYVRGNIAVISGRANTLKSNGTPEEHVRIAAWMRAHESKER